MGCGVLLIGAAGFATSTESPLPISAIQVTGGSTELTPAVVSALGVQTGQSFSSVDVGQAQERISAIDGVESADLAWSWWNTMTVVVHEQTPIAAQAQADGTFVVLDPTGGSIRIAPARPAGLPLIQADGSAAVAAALEVAAAIPADAGVDTIVAPTAHHVTLHLASGQSVVLGAPESVPEKFALARQLAPTGAKVINVTVLDRPSLQQIPPPPKS